MYRERELISQSNPSSEQLASTRKQEIWLASEFHRNRRKWIANTSPAYLVKGTNCFKETHLQSPFRLVNAWTLLFSLLILETFVTAWKRAIELSADQHLNFLGLGPISFQVYYTEFSCRRVSLVKRKSNLLLEIIEFFFGSDTGAVQRINISLGGDYPVGSLTVLSGGSSIYVIVIQPAVDNNTAAENQKKKEISYFWFYEGSVEDGEEVRFDLVLFAQAGNSLDWIPNTPPSTNTTEYRTFFR